MPGAAVQSTPGTPDDGSSLDSLWGEKALVNAVIIVFQASWFTSRTGVVDAPQTCVGSMPVINLTGVCPTHAGELLPANSNQDQPSMSVVT